MGLWAAEVTPLQFSLVAESAMPPTPTFDTAGYRLVAAVDGWREGRVYLATWREGLLIRGQVMDTSMLVWGESVPTARGTVKRFGELIVRAEIKGGFKVEIDGMSPLLVRRPRYGLFPRQRQIVVTQDERRWVYRSLSPWATGLIRADGVRCAVFKPWSTQVADDAVPIELVMALVIIAQRLWLRVGSPLALTAGINLPRLGGDQFVV
jgi:hypothetical protein